MLKPLCLIKQIGLNQGAANKHVLARSLPLVSFGAFVLFLFIPSVFWHLFVMFRTVICNSALGVRGSQILWRYIRTLCIAFHIKCHLVSAFCQSPWRSRRDGQSISCYGDFGRSRRRTLLQSMPMCGLVICECLRICDAA